MAISSAAYTLKDTFDAEVFRHMEQNVTIASQALGTITAATDVGYDSGETSPYAVLNRLSRLLDDQNVPSDNRWAVARPKFWEVAKDENAKLMDASVTGEGSTQMRNGLITDKMVAGFRIYNSNNVPNSSSSGNSDWTSATDCVLAGHMSAMATASQIATTETYRDPFTFADVVRGLHLYGRKVLRGTALAVCYYSID